MFTRNGFSWEALLSANTLCCGSRSDPIVPKIIEPAVRREYRAINLLLALDMLVVHSATQTRRSSRDRVRSSVNLAVCALGSRTDYSSIRPVQPNRQFAAYARSG